MRCITIVGSLVLVLLAGCTSVKPTASQSPQVIQAPRPAEASTPAIQPPVATQPTPTAPTQNSADAAEHPTPVPTSTTITNVGTDSTKVATVSAGNSVKPATPVKRATPSKQPTVTPVPDKASVLSTPNVPAKVASPPLDLASLEQRLRDTHAIGVFTKLSLKNQVDDLLDEFRALYQGKIKTPLTELRQRYDMLLMKLLTLLQDSDATLAAAIMSSREAIWDILKDPQKFAQI